MIASNTLLPHPAEVREIAVECIGTKPDDFSIFVARHGQREAIGRTMMSVVTPQEYGMVFRYRIEGGTNVWQILTWLIAAGKSPLQNDQPVPGRYLVLFYTGLQHWHHLLQR